MASRRHLEYGRDEGDRKKNDDSQTLRSGPIAQMLWYLRNVRRRRVLLALLSLWLLYTFFRNIPTDVLPVGQRLDSRYGKLGLPVYTGRGSGGQKGQLLDEEYDGPVRFFDLAQTLHRYIDEPPLQDTVLFAFASPHAASHVISAACAMATYKRTMVHVASMGKEVITLAQVLKLNGIQADDCPVHWHDAQPDFAVQSSIMRLAKGVEGAFGHIQRSLSLRTVFYDRSEHEVAYLRRSITKAARNYGVAAIPVPARDAWMLALDGSSLSEWPKLQIDIVIRAEPESAGALLRLLRSIHAADYGGLPYPRIVIELPPRTDAAILDRLAGFVWPPRSQAGESKLIVQRRMDDRPLTVATSSLQMVESFYPVSASSHVLVLAPEVEVSTKFYQLLVYLILEYRHADRTVLLRNGMIGISLLGSTKPTLEGSLIQLSQRIDAKAELYFGEKWAEMHHFLSLRLAADPSLSRTIEPIDKASTEQPGWARLVSELVKVQGYSMLQIASMNGTAPLAVVHSDPRAVLEEDFQQGRAVPTDLDLSVDGDVFSVQSRTDTAAKFGQMPAASVLSFVRDGTSGTNNFIGDDQVPFYDADDTPVDRAVISEQATAYAQRFASTVGGCSDLENVQFGRLESLFC